MRIAFASCVVVLCMVSGCKVYDSSLASPSTATLQDAGPMSGASTRAAASTAASDEDAGTAPQVTGGADAPTSLEAAAHTGTGNACAGGECWWSNGSTGACRSVGRPFASQRPSTASDGEGQLPEIYLGWTRVSLGETGADGKPSDAAWQSFGLDLDGKCTNAATCSEQVDVQSCRAATKRIPYDGALCRDNRLASLQPMLAAVPEIGKRYGIGESVFNCNLWRGTYNVVLKLSGYNGDSDDPEVRADFYMSPGLQRLPPWTCPVQDFSESYPLWQVSADWQIDKADLTAEVAKPGSLPASKIADVHAYVRGGYLVAELPDDAVLRLVGASSAYRGFALKTVKSVWTGNLRKAQDGTWKLHDGLVAGRVRTGDLAQSFRGLGLCPGEGAAAAEQNGYYQLLSDAIRENADLRADGQVDANVECDALSFGIAFEAAQLTPGATVAAPALLSCCAPGLAPEDCDPKCGDGRVNGAEKCDTAIAAGKPGACPSDCPDLDACTPQMLMGEQCNATCVAMPIKSAGPRDGCCPAGANQLQDRDCKAACGNGVVEQGESCDPGNASCSMCQSKDKCMVAKPTGAASSCNLQCNFTPVTQCKGGDGCCPDDCTSQDDSDCSASCGNGVLEGSEKCENGSDKPCPSSCDDKDACTVDSSSGAAQSCTAECKHSRITSTEDGDGCCPSGANASTDSDCKASCGNGTTEPGEDCDDGNTKNGDGCDSACKKESDSQSCSSLAGTGSCASCHCEKCQRETVSCLGASDAKEAKECKAVEDCAAAKGCSASECYCSASNWARCAAGMPDGPCHLEIEAAAHSPNPDDIFARTGDTAYPLGRATALGECLRANCASVCGK